MNLKIFVGFLLLFQINCGTNVATDTSSNPPEEVKEEEKSIIVGAERLLGVDDWRTAAG